LVFFVRGMSRLVFCSIFVLTDRLVDKRGKSTSFICILQMLREKCSLRIANTPPGAPLRAQQRMQRMQRSMRRCMRTKKLPHKKNMAQLC
jgi:hypothetical protein